MEAGVDIQTQKEYLDYSESFDRGELSDEQTTHLGSLLWLPKVPPEQKKRALTLLAHLGTVTAYRQIEKYHEGGDPEVKPWAALALQECRMFLESTLLDESVGFIASGLGAVKDKMRFYFLLLPLADARFSASQHEIIRSGLESVASELNCNVENLYPSEAFFGLTALVSNDVAVATFIETTIKRCNEVGNFVFEYYYVTNQNIPDDPEISEIIRKVRE
jgi:hypothetical protein